MDFGGRGKRARSVERAWEEDQVETLWEDLEEISLEDQVAREMGESEDRN